MCHTNVSDMKMTQVSWHSLWHMCQCQCRHQNFCVSVSVDTEKNRCHTSLSRQASRAEVCFHGNGGTFVINNTDTKPLIHNFTYFYMLEMTLGWYYCIFRRLILWICTLLAKTGLRQMPKQKSSSRPIRMLSLFILMNRYWVNLRAIQ